ncbi:ABC transporter permease subunit [Chelativorans sp. J32]|uniref:ABC transporter permease subunit n=1 Tax=Chelativorans sp. J32 TaxID=935840 RepID=UPI001FD95F9B|nr:ABC transporter permease subunit [Chelativorans sp. J32]
MGVERLHLPHLLRGLRNLPTEYIEAARVDGASPWTILTKIKLPLLMPATVVVLGIAGIDSMRSSISFGP